MLNKQKGITLIALIITIIVMLILVGVTINVVLTGGLFTKAQEGAERTQAATEKEQLLNAVLGTLDDNGKINLSQIQLPEGFKKISEDTTKVVYEGPSANQYEVEKESGKIEKVSKDGNGGAKTSIAGIYGNKEYGSLYELQENGVGVYYGESGEPEATIEYDDNTIILKWGEDESDEEIFNYTYEEIKDEETGEIINRFILMEGEHCLTTNGSEGFIFNSYDGKHYKRTYHAYSNLYFANGYYEYSKGSSATYDYCVYGGYIWTVSSVNVFRRSFEINEDGSLTKIGDEDTADKRYIEVITEE